MKLFGYNLNFTQPFTIKRHSEEERSHLSAQEPPPAYATIFPKLVTPDQPVCEPENVNQARPFPIDWQLSIGSPHSVLRGGTRPDENLARRV
ncbi:hypothetical protein CROQUDRAFT_672974 [Cronartium quercuum f. sp. fusiforme G11]|uniref:Uncharacterized protein n=1 Tax=Cronartium quercuum f. sp. fusiforme G11 TaxID=708437 RepID=A0A9P6T8V0_9BASI|nr:hypothetical protein CROQUDRAFT_672974 [Cronartium quercuum f. sp. fusiforme G11]